MIRFICHFLIVWLTLLSGGAYAHAAADAAHEAGHTAVHASQVQATDAGVGASSTFSQTTEKMDVANENGHSEACSLSHCGHSYTTGVLPAVRTRLDDALRSAPLPTIQPWASRELPNNIERPKWVHTTPSVVNL